MHLKWWQTAALAGLFTSVAAQTYSECNPMTDTSCNPNDGLSSSTYSVDFTNGSDDDNWSSVGSGDVEYTSTGAEFTINKKGNAPTIQTNWYIFFGRVEVHLKAAPGTGIVSSAVLLSDVLDEVDWEWLGGSPEQVQTNYYGKGNSTSDTRSATYSITDGQATFHNYTIHWTKETCVWYVNGEAVRTLNYADALGGENYPQTPMRVKLGIWAGGDSDNAEGTIEWAGGETDYSAAPFTMTVQSVKIENFNPADTYTYSGQSGSYESIKFDASDDDSSSNDKSSTKVSTTTSVTKASTSASTDASTTGISTGTSTDTSTGASTTETSGSSTTEGFQNNNAAGSTSTETAATPDAETSSAAPTSGAENSAWNNAPGIWLALGVFSTALSFFL